MRHTESTFYQEGLANFTEQQFADAGFNGSFYKNLMEISSDEKTHVTFLTTALNAAGYTPVEACTYAFGVTDPKSFVMTDSILEGVGVSAYLGAAMDIMDKMYLTAAGSILTVEARHSAYIRTELGESPFPAPFDVPLDLNEVYTLAAPFIVSCPASNPKLPVKAFPSLTLDAATPMPVKVGDTVKFALKANTALPATKIYAAFITVNGPVFQTATVVDGGNAVMVKIPESMGVIAGQSYVVLTSEDKHVTDDCTLAGPGIVEITPAYELA